MRKAVMHASLLFDDSEQLAVLRIGELFRVRSEEHTSELQSRFDLVCRLLLEKKKRESYQTEQHRDCMEFTVAALPAAQSSSFRLPLSLSLLHHPSSLPSPVLISLRSAAAFVF